MKKKFVIHQDIVLGFFFLLMSALFYIGARDFPDNVAQFPKLFSIIMAVLSIPVILKGFHQNKELKQAVEENPNTKVALSWAELRYPTYTLLSILLYIGGILYVGFFISSAIYMILFMYLLKYRNWVVVIGTTAILLGGIYLIFVRLLSISLPAGLLF